MWCPHCQSPDLKVVDSRPAGETTRRRRHCNACNLRFTTFERVEQFICPSCQSPNSRVRIRELSSGVTVRQRECLGCRARFETRENAQTSDLMVVKRDLRRERFDRSKIVASVRVATAKLPVPTARIDRLVDDVVVDITRRGLREVQSVEIGSMVMTRLREVSSIAFVRFASVYESITDLEGMSSQISTLRRRMAQPADPRQFVLIPSDDESK